MILESLVEKWSVRPARKRGYKAGWLFLDGQGNPPWYVVASMEEILDDLAPRKPHIAFGMVDGDLALGMICQREARQERWGRAWVKNFRSGFHDAIAEAVQPAQSARE
jgi:hypothetical protein